jgi:Colicin-E5 Imm protein
MKIDLQQRYESSDDFFNLDGSVVMKVSADAAVAICEHAARHGLVVARIEGGIWHAPGFEARLDCIWDGVEPPVDQRTAEQNNRMAVEFIQAERMMHDVYVITAPHMTGG